LVSEWADERKRWLGYNTRWKHAVRCFFRNLIGFGRPLLYAAWLLPVLTWQHLTSTECALHGFILFQIHHSAAKARDEWHRSTRRTRRLPLQHSNTKEQKRSTYEEAMLGHSSDD
jgi:hypothetical protein